MAKELTTATRAHSQSAHNPCLLHPPAPVTRILETRFSPRLASKLIVCRLLLHSTPDIASLRTLGTKDVPQLAGRVANTGLLIIETVKFGVQRVAQRADISLRVKHFPGLMALLRLTRLENHEEGIEAVSHVLKWTTGDAVARCKRGCIVAVVVLNLGGVTLWVSGLLEG